MNYRSYKPYKIMGTGKGNSYPRINLPCELSDLIGNFYFVEIDDSGVITLTPAKQD